MQSVSFIDAVKSAFAHYADFKGRSRRSEYWWFTLFNMIVSVIIGAIIPELAGVWSLSFWFLVWLCVSADCTTSARAAGHT